MPKLTVHILLATYNGDRFLAEQLKSIARQTHLDWTLTVSDDGSTDETLNIVADFTKKVMQKVDVITGPRKGSSTKNFFHLIQQAQAKDTSDLFAFCDQDDVWLEDKLKRAVAWHIMNIEKPVRLYCGRTRFVDKNLKPLGLSPRVHRLPSFGNALVQNIASGNTMVFSHAVLLAQKKVHPEHSVWHDWTSYIVATACGGCVEFDNEPSLLYRQHAANVIGSNHGLMAQLRRLRPLLHGRFKNWTSRNLAAICDLEPLLTEPARIARQQLITMHSAPYVSVRFCAYVQSTIRRQTFASNVNLGMAVLLNVV